MISVVTVVYNGVSDIQRSFDSVAKLAENVGLEYVVIDGASTDGTIAVLHEIKNKYSYLFNSFVLISEPDNGLYHAMNKALDYVTSDYVIYLNCGDYFSERASEIVSSKYNYFISHEFDVLVFGVCSYNSTGRVSSRRFNGPEDLKKAPAIPHQATFVKASLLKEVKFDQSFKILADYDHFCRLYSLGVNFILFDEVISYFKLGGISNNWRYQSVFIKELFAIQKKNFKKISLLSIVYFVIRAFYLVLPFSEAFDSRVRSILIGLLNRLGFHHV